MTTAAILPVSRSFADYVGDLGQRWGVPRDACRVHALLYVLAKAASENDLAEALDLKETEFEQALAFLVDYRLVDRVGTAMWRTGTDPWELLIKGLEERRRRELPEALVTLRECHAAAMADTPDERAAAQQIEKMLKLVEDLASLDAHMPRISPQLIGRVISTSGRAARIFDQTFGKGRRGTR